MGKHSCTIVFCDEMTGEMEYEVQGIGALPEVEPFKEFKCYLDKNDPIELEVPYENKKVTKALDLHFKSRFNYGPKSPEF